MYFFDKGPMRFGALERLIDTSAMKAGGSC
jgi:hypothetical protein